MPKHVCKICKKSFIYKSSLSLHMKSHTDRMHRCVECGSAYVHPANLRTHMAREHPPIPTAKHTCKTCKKSFPYACSLKRHMLSHSDLRAHRCSDCGQTFKRVDEVRAHQKREHPEDDTENDVQDPLFLVSIDLCNSTVLGVDLVPFLKQFDPETTMITLHSNCPDYKFVRDEVVRRFQFVLFEHTM